jgi:hypothetical protein
LIQEEIAKRLICFGVYGASLFQGYHIGMTFQLQEKYVPYMIGQHCMANMTNFIVQALSNLPMMAKLEDLHNHYILIFPIMF